MLRVTVTTTIPSKGKPSNWWFHFEANYPDLASLLFALTNERAVMGMRVFTEEDGKGGRVVTKRVPCILGLGAVGVISPAISDYREAADV